MSVHYDFEVQAAEGEDVALEGVSSESLQQSVDESLRQSESGVDSTVRRLRHASAERRALSRS